jgi:hypothetical protein
MNKTIISFEDDLKNVLKFKSLGFECNIDDEINKIYCCELNLNEYDLLNVLNISEECLDNNLNPFIILDDVYYNLNNEDDLKIIDNIVSKSPLLI